MNIVYLFIFRVIITYINVSLTENIVTWPSNLDRTLHAYSIFIVVEFCHRFFIEAFFSEQMQIILN